MAGRAIYSTTGRTPWLAKLPTSARALAEQLYLELDALMPMRKRAEQAMLAEARTHRAYRIV